MPQQSDNAPFTFTLPTLFYLATVFGVSIYLGVSVVVLTTFVLFAWAILFSTNKSEDRNKIGVVVIWSVLFLVWLASITSPLVTPSFSTRRIECQNRIQQLSLATLEYEGAHLHFPAAHINDENATPTHSWRVLVLPYLGYEALFETYDFDEPWDSLNNAKLLTQMPSEFQCPSHLHNGKTTYKLVTGLRTAFVEDKTSGFGDIKDGSSNTLMIVEDFANPIPWTKPEDLTIDEVVEIIERSNQAQRSSCCAHKAKGKFWKSSIGTCASLLDGSTHLIFPLSNPQQIRPLCTIDDGESVRLGDLKTSKQSYRKPEAWASLVIFVLLLLLPGWVLWRRTVSR